MTDVSRSIKEGVSFGLIAGALLAIAEVIAMAVSGHPPIMALRVLASVFLGPDALSAIPTATAVGVGIFGHLYLSAMYGLFYGVYNSALTMRTRSSLGREAVVGLLFGAMLWLVNFQVFARVRAPWLLALPPLHQVFLHAVCFGLPLGVLYASAERRVARHAPHACHVQGVP